MLDAQQGRMLLALARSAISQELGEASRAPWPNSGLPPDWLRNSGATFVTLTQAGELRGCIGSLEAHRSLLEDVAANARAAAFGDPRFPPLTAGEWPGTRVEVSLLSPAEPMHCRDEADCLAQLRPGLDGVILEQGWHRATFLPQVWEQLPDARQFMAQLKRKAGLATDFWGPDLRISRYRVEKFEEADHDVA